MAIKERKQITGTAAQIKGFAGHNGVLAYATDTKHLHVLSGTAGTTTELANRTDIPDITGKADTTYVDTQLSTKATKAELTNGLAGKANSSHTHTIANVTGLQDALNSASTQASNAIPKEGHRGALKGYESSTEGTIVNDMSPDTQHTADNVIVSQGNDTVSWTKVVDMTAGTVTLDSNWVWSGGKAPVLKYPGVLTCHWNGSNRKGIAIYTAGAS